MPLESSSSFRHFGQRDDRRRRLLTDDLSQSSDWSGRRVGAENVLLPRKSDHYGDAEFLEEQWQLLDLIPCRAVSLISILSAAAAIIAGLEFSYAWMLDRAAEGGPMFAAFDLAAKGSLGSWFSSLTLLAASAASILVYTVRRFRTDDYQGRYRIWLWAAACWFLLAADQAANLREAFRHLMISLTGTSLAGDGSLWWAVLYAFLLGAVGSRLVMDMRSSLPAVGWLVTAAVVYTVAAVGRLGWTLFENAGRQIMFLTGLEMAGNLILLTAITLYARHVLFDAQGLLPHREPKLEPEESEHNEAATARVSGDRWRKIDPPHVTPQPAAYQHPATVSCASPPKADTIASPINRKLTKGERKALKERLLRERMERERRGLS